MFALLQIVPQINPTLPYLWYKIALAILIGLLIGIEREATQKKGEKAFAGIRTFPLISLLGFLTAFISSFTSFNLYIAFFLIFGILVSIAYFFSARQGELGGTTEIAFILVYILGSLIFWDYLLISAAAAVVVLTFLTLKSALHKFVGNVEMEDLYAAIKFAIITIIVLPLLPDENYGPFEVFNPRKIWYMVVLIAGISFIGYLLFKIVGTKKGIQLLSILGGIVSSTAVTLSFTSRSKEVEKLSRNFAAGIILASTIMFPRLLIVIYVLAPAVAQELLIPFFIFISVGIVVSLLLWKTTGSNQTDEIKLTNPFKVMFAVKFGLIFAVILFVSAAAQFYYGDRGIYIASFFSGFADVDAVALSMSDLVKTKITAQVAALAIVMASFANSLVKGFIASTMGSKELRRYISKGFAAIIGVMIVYMIVISLVNFS
ncbi:MAG: MgtC/SapB family protein [bacterium]